MATAVEEPRKRTRSRKSNYMEENDLQTLTSVPSIPDEFDPGTYTTLKDTDFDDQVTYLQYRRALHVYEIEQIDDRIKEIESVPEESRGDYAVYLEQFEKLIALQRKMSKNGVDKASLYAKVQAKLSP